MFLLSFTWIFGGIIAAAAAAAAIVYLVTHIKFAWNLAGYSFWQTLHLTSLKMKFYDQQLNDNVPYARHALSINENRADLDRVPWGDPKAKGFPRQKGDPEWFEQIWFAGNHSDIGGGYPENESRLSDIPLSPAGPQHDECKSGRFGFLWKKGSRKIVATAPLHPSVYERFALGAVLEYDEIKPYRPEPLRAHEKLKQYYN